MIRRPVRPSLTPIKRHTPLRPIGARGLKRRAQYERYLKSAWWQSRRAAFIALLMPSGALALVQTGVSLGTVDIVSHRLTLDGVANYRGLCQLSRRSN